MIPKEILKQIKRIQIRTGRMVNDVFAGQYSSVFKGRGMEFSEVREYQPGDEVRTIDWNVSARYGRPFVKKFTEERELTIMLLVDMSRSEKFGTKDKTKEEIAAEIASVLAFSAVKNNDKVGMIIFTDKIEKYIPPKKTITHILRIISEILYYKPENTGTDITVALEYLCRVQKKRATVFIISDFIDPKGYAHALRVAGRKHDLVAITLTDKREENIPAGYFYELTDGETGQRVVIDARNQDKVNEFIELARQERVKKEQLFKKSKIDFIPISTDKPYADPLLKFFYMRERRFR
ncbi:MAG: DUF58 domain-containing protein [Elusimicrobia bacterium]|nr:DUF58 domain-containing protein [Elusimicrobiota bacterium]MBU2614642.1 DUF58 domain-containing protein [Elusimicrobiota bacterium]